MRALAILFLFGFQAEAQVAFSGNLARVSCFPSSAATMRDDLENANVTIQNMSGANLDDTRRAMIAGMAKRISTLAQGNPQIMRKLTVQIFPGSGRPGASKNMPCSSYTPNQTTVQIAPGCYQGDSPLNTVTHFAHEVGHTVGLSGYYKSFKSEFTDKKVPPCKVSKMCTEHDNPNGNYREEFAEIFATYVHAPSALQATCPAQYKWFREKVFGLSSPDPMSSNCKGTADATVAVNDTKTANPNFRVTDPGQHISAETEQEVDKNGNPIASIMQQGMGMKKDKGTKTPERYPAATPAPIPMTVPSEGVLEGPATPWQN
ncbi:MAG TPA: hypothetical protein PKC28_03085 [Bdellovibrionales bacterium]|nr:hypothetical protein [Bdellovibrionales bacterium]